jgi:hypothetical protein
MGPGVHHVGFRPAGLPGGVYFLRLDAGGDTATKGVVVLR